MSATLKPDVRGIDITQVPGDEVLEALWMMREAQVEGFEELAHISGEKNLEPILSDLQKIGMLKRNGKWLEFTVSGEKRAEQVVRRHRLAERLFCDLFGLGEESYESSACSFEHIIDPEVTRSVCTFLGHPPVCPHGKPIPRGDCCVSAQKEVESIIQPLSELNVGESGRIAFIAHTSPARFERLVALGICPGSELRLHQKLPAFVVEVGATTLAIETSIARQIFVKRVESK